MNEEIKVKLRRYEELKIQAKDIDNELEMLKPDIVAAMPEDSKIDTGVGVFTLNRKRSWKYSALVVDTENELKDMKKREEADGTAEEVMGTPFLVYKQNA